MNVSTIKAFHNILYEKNDKTDKRIQDELSPEFLVFADRYNIQPLVDECILVLGKSFSIFIEIPYPVNFQNGFPTANKDGNFHKFYLVKNLVK